jgi:polar amino acid transport system substrate-binding protein
MLSAWVLGAVTTVSSSVAGTAGDTLDGMRQRGEIAFGADVQGGEPYVFEDPKDPTKLIGFEVDIANALGRRLGVAARIHQADWSNLVPALERGDFDAIMNGLEDTPARRDRILVSAPYFVFGETLAVRRGSRERTLEDLRGARVGTLNQSFAYDLLRERGFDPVLYEGVSEPYMDLELGRSGAVLLDHIIAARYGCNRPGIECLPGDVARGNYIIGIRRGDGRLKAAMDDAIAKMLADGELRSILEHWKLWDARQNDLERSTPASAAAPPAEAPRSFGTAEATLFLEGAAVTIGLSIAAFALALPAGLLLALARLAEARRYRWFASAYVELFRGTPLLLQLYVLYYALAPVVKLGPMTAAILGRAMYYAAYEAEIQRGALLAVPRGQAEAARALGLTRFQALEHVLLPQSLRIALPSMTNDFVALLKDSSLVSVITVVELTKRMTIAAVDLRSWLVPGILCAALYFAMSYPLARLAQRLERKLHRDHHPGPA